MNNKGFAITSFLYGILIAFLLIFSILLINVINTRLSLNSIKINVKEEFEDNSYTQNKFYANIIVENQNVLMQINKSIDLLADVHIEKYDGTILDNEITYTSSPTFNNSEEGIYVINYSTTINGVEYVNHKIVEVIGNLEFVYDCTENVQTFVAPRDGSYKVELWGAQGGGGAYNSAVTRAGGNGAYTSGVISLNKGEELYIYVGGKGIDGTSTSAGGYNGGGNGGIDSSDGDDSGGGGGGSTDIRYNGTSINDRIMVAAGGGGAARYGTGYVAGALTLNNVTQTSGNAFYQGAAGTNNSNGMGGGGGGYYGGKTRSNGYGSYGGSSYISGHVGSVAITSSTNTNPKTGCADGTTDVTCSYHYSGKIFEQTQMIAGNSSMPSTNGETETGHVGNGYAKISYVFQEA